MLSSTLGRLFLLSRRRSQRGPRLANPFRSCAAEVLESRVLLAATLFVDPASTKPSVFHTIQAAVNAAPSGSTIKLCRPSTTKTSPLPSPSQSWAVRCSFAGRPAHRRLSFNGRLYRLGQQRDDQWLHARAESGFNNSPLFAILAANSPHSRFSNNIINNADPTLGGGVTNSEVANNSGDFEIEVINATSSAANSNDTFTDNIITGGSIFLEQHGNRRPAHRQLCAERRGI